MLRCLICERFSCFLRGRMVLVGYRGWMQFSAVPIYSFVWVEESLCRQFEPLKKVGDAIYVVPVSFKPSELAHALRRSRNKEAIVFKKKIRRCNYIQTWLKLRPTTDLKSNQLSPYRSSRPNLLYSYISFVLCSSFHSVFRNSCTVYNPLLFDRTVS